MGINGAFSLAFCRFGTDIQIQEIHIIFEFKENLLQVSDADMFSICLNAIKAKFNKFKANKEFVNDHKRH